MSSLHMQLIDDVFIGEISLPPDVSLDILSPRLQAYIRCRNAGTPRLLNERFICRFEAIKPLPIMIYSPRGLYVYCKSYKYFTAFFKILRGNKSPRLPLEGNTWDLDTINNSFVWNRLDVVNVWDVLWGLAGGFWRSEEIN